MTLAAWTGVALYALLCIGAGRCMLFLCRLPKEELTHNWASCYLAGQLVILMLTLVTAFVPIPLAPLQLALAVTVLLAASIYLVRQPRTVGGLLLSGLAAFLVSGVLFPDVWLVTQYTPLWEWDARSYWFFHGKVVFLDDGVKSAFFADPVNAWSHRNYPLFMAAQSAWLSIIVGDWNDVTAKAFLWINFAAYLDLFRLVLRRGCGRWWFWVPVLIVLFDQETYSYVSGIADPHYAAPLLLFMAAWCIPGAGNPAFMALMLAFAANMKNESAVYVILAVSVIAAWYVFRPLLRGRRQDLAAALAGKTGPIALGLVLGFVPWLTWSVYRCVHGIAERDQVMARLADGHTFFANLSGRALPILAYFAENYAHRRAHLLLAVLILLVVFRHLRGRETAERRACRYRYLWVVFLVLNGLVFLPYVVTTWDLGFHLGTSAGRLLLLPFLVLILLLAEESRRIVSCFTTDIENP